MEQFEIHSIQDLEKLSFDVSWQYFEKLVAYIFEENGFDVRQNVVVMRDKERRQYDVIAKKGNETFLVECKRWKSRAGIESAVKDAVENHVERCVFYNDVNPSEKTTPLLVIPLEGLPEEHQNVFIVPLLSLNWFLNSQ